MPEREESIFLLFSDHSRPLPSPHSRPPPPHLIRLQFSRRNLQKDVVRQRNFHVRLCRCVAAASLFSGTASADERRRALHVHHPLALLRPFADHKFVDGANFFGRFKFLKFFFEISKNLFLIIRAYFVRSLADLLKDDVTLEQLLPLRGVTAIHLLPAASLQLFLLRGLLRKAQFVEGNYARTADALKLAKTVEN